MTNRADRDVHLDCDRRYDEMADSRALVLAEYDRLWTAYFRLLRSVSDATHTEATGPRYRTPSELRETAGP